jgi:catechol 2,3-dioxygenase-like lactoylglutathione lyase family enzyme
MSIIRLSAVTTALLTSLAAQQAPAPAGVVAGVGNFSHIVANMDRAIEFYRDVIGLEMPGQPGAFSGNPAIMNLGNTLGAQSRAATLRVPGSALGVELIEYKDIDRTPAHPRFQDPGAATLILSVRDLDAIVARVKKSQGRIQTLSGVPAAMQGGSKTIFIQDPDGFFVELSQRAPGPGTTAPATTAPAASNVIGGNFEIMVADTDKTMRLYKEALGFEPQAATAFDGNKLLMDTVGTPGAQFRRSVATIPGTSVFMAFLEFKDIDRKPIRTRTQDPGQPILQLRVRDVEAAGKAWKAAGGEIVSARGEPVTIGANKIVLLRDPNGLMLEVLPAPQQR